jgi:hypothetical protein
MEALNTALAQLRYMPANNTNGGMVLSVEVEDLCCPNSSFVSPSVRVDLPIEVAPRNDPPRILLDCWTDNTPKRQSTIWKNVTKYLNLSVANSGYNGSSGTLDFREPVTEVVVDESKDAVSNTLLSPVTHYFPQ